MRRIAFATCCLLAFLLGACASHDETRRSELEAGGTLPWNRPASWKGSTIYGTQIRAPAIFLLLMAGRILVIRGGALGDFILTLPAIRLLREKFPDSPLEVLGHLHIATLAEGRYYASSIRSIDRSRLSAFFHPDAPLDPELCRYFAGFHQILSYIYDHDKVFQSRLRMAGAQNLISVSPKIGQDGHAARQLARPLEEFSMRLEDPAARIFPQPRICQKRRFSFRAWQDRSWRFIRAAEASRRTGTWRDGCKVQAEILRNRKVGHLLVVGGESDFPQLSRMRRAASSRQTVLTNLPLPLLGSVLSRCSLFIGHDSGVSHLAAAAGARCLLIFGPTNPDVWAPANDAVEVLRANDAQISSLETELVLGRMNETLNDVSRNDCVR